jgi:hypothetical protein
MRLPEWQVGLFRYFWAGGVARCWFLLRRVARQRIGLTAEFGLEGGVALPAGEGVGVDFEGGSDGGDRVACEEKAGAGELVGAQGFGRSKGRGLSAQWWV